MQHDYLHIPCRHCIIIIIIIIIIIFIYTRLKT